MSEELRKELKETILENIDKKSLDEAPPLGYFDHLADNVLAKAQASSPANSPGKVVSMRWLSAAASLALILGLMYWLTVPQSTEEQSIMFAEASADDIIDYVYDDVDLLDLAELDEVGFSGIDLAEEFSELGENDINIYLEEDIELDELIEFL